MKEIKAILLMGGSGERFGSFLPKQFHRLSGKPVYLHTVEKFVESQLFEEIILVCHEDWISEIPKGMRAVKAGKTRQESSYLGLLACGEGTHIVVIHDAVRPFVTTEILKQNVEAARRYGAVDTCIASADTIVHAQEGQVLSIPNRAEYLRGQTPQSFSYPLILEAHKKTTQKNASDDCRLILEMGKPVHLIQGDEANIKITTELDLFLAEKLLQRKQTLSSSPKISLSGKRFIVAGGTGDIGQSICTQLREEGAEPIVISRSSSEYPADLTCYEKAEEIFNRIGPVDGLINSIGLFKLKEVKQLSSIEIEELIQVNLTSLIYCCKCVQLKEGGHILNIASSSYSRGRKEFAIYSSAKAAVVNFTQGLAEEWPHLHINALVPERANTKLRQLHFPNEDPATLLEPKKIADTIILLLKQKLTGNIVDVRTFS